MATSTKKKPAKKAATRTKRAPAKSASRTKVARRSAPKRTQSFKRVQPAQPFMTFRITEQTLYWLILSLIVLMFGAWVLSMNDRIQRLYDEVDSARIASQSLELPVEKVKK